jgi:two-component system alkaline phosphatase synthesis response regulator PhoP
MMERAKYVLVIDDDPAIFGEVQSQLANEGITILQAFSGHAGVDIASSRTPDLILLGNWTNGAVDYQVWEELRKVPMMVGVQILTLPAHSGRNLHGEEYDSGSSGREPGELLEPTTLVKTIRKAFASGPSSTPTRNASTFSKLRSG